MQLLPRARRGAVSKHLGGILSMHVLDVPLRPLTEAKLLDSFDEGMLVFHNIDTIYKSQSDAQFREVCRSAEFSVVDSQVLRGLLRLTRAGRIDKVCGADFLPAFCRRHAGDPSVRVFLLGAGPGVADKARLVLNEASGREIVVGAHSPSFNLLDDHRESSEIIDKINASGATVLAVGMGAPKQEIWMARHREDMPGITRLMAVGATLDFQAGRIKRAPAWINALGMEWLFRLMIEPRRLWRRYMVQGPRIIFAMLRAGRLVPEEETSDPSDM